MTGSSKSDRIDCCDEDELSASAAKRLDQRFDFDADGFEWIPKDVRWAVAMVTRMFDAVPERVLQEHSLTHAERDARVIAIYVIHIEGGVSMSEISRRLDLTLSGVSRIVSRVEDWRSEPRWDSILDGISTALRTGKQIRPLLKDHE